LRRLIYFKKIAYSRDKKEKMTKVIGKLSYEPNDKIGQGAFGTVFSGFYNLLLYSESTPVAIKQIQISRVKEDDIKKEVELMIKAKDHPNILRYIFMETNDDFM